MNKWILPLFVFAGLFLLTSNDSEPKGEVLTAPNGWPDPIYKRRISKDGFQLGKKLFYDANLSRDGSTSCANCHLSFSGFTHVDHALSHGIDDRIGIRNSPVLINLAWNSSFHWDGGVNHLEMQAINPIQHPNEMDNTLELVLSYLNDSREYRSMFFDAFGDSTASTPLMLRAFGQFTASLVSSNSLYDKVQRGEVKFTDQQASGYQLFQQYCSVCHQEPLFNTNEFKNNGLPLDTVIDDLGRFNITFDPKDSLHFRVPTLRNIEFSRPYMHDGRFETLREVVDHYSEINLHTKHLSPELKERISISDNEKKDIISFLKTLTDKEFLYNPRYRP